MRPAPRARVGALVGIFILLHSAGARDAVPASGGRGADGVGRTGLAGKCAPALLERLASPEAPETLIVWIYFADRSCGGSATAPRVPAAARHRLSRTHAARDERYLSPCAGYIDRIRPHLRRLRHVSSYFNAVSAVVSASELPAICECPFVRGVEEVSVFRAPLEPPGAEVDPPGARLRGRTAAHDYGGSYAQLDQIGVIPLLEKGYNGSGNVTGGEAVRIGVLDSGFRRDHEALSGVAVDAEWDFVQGDSVTSNQAGDPPTQDSHGTAVLGVIAGHAEGRLIGPAWGARYLLAKTEIINASDEIVEEDNWVAGIEWADTNGADVVTSSLGYIDWYTQEDLDGRTAKCTIAADIAAAHGIVVVNSTGNSGSLGLVAPADGFDVLAIGAVDRTGAIASFSSRGPTADGRTKPDFVALGVASYTVVPGDPDAYTTGNGTSYAAPLFAGACALLIEKQPGRDPVELRGALRSSASRSGSPDNAYGWGIPDFQLAAGCEAVPAAPAAFPNPFTERTMLRFYSATPELVTARVYDCRGALVRTLLSGERRYCAWELAWDGTRDVGGAAESGVYFALVTRNSITTTFKLIRIR